MPRRIMAASVMSLLSAGPALAQSEAGFGDWMAFCDNVRFCSAYGVQAENDFEGAFIRLARGPEANARPAISIYPPGDLPNEVKLELLVDDAPASGPLKGRLAVEVRDDVPRLVLSPEQTDTMLAVLRRAAVLTVVARPATGEPEQRSAISLSGGSAALRWLDEQQKRAGTATALVALGERPANAIPAPPDPATITAAKAAAQPAVPPPLPASLTRVVKNECEDEPDNDPIVLRLGGGRTLWGMLCDRAAYNTDYAFYLVEDGKDAAEPVSFEVPAALRSYQDEGNHLTNPDKGSEPLTVTSFSKGRGIADCGSTGTWLWDGTAFRLVEFRAMPECRGIPPDEWPRLWHARRR